MMLLLKWTFVSKRFAYYYLLITILQKKKLTLRGGGGGISPLLGMPGLIFSTTSLSLLNKKVSQWHFKNKGFRYLVKEALKNT